MSEGTNSKSSLDPAELWKQWYETSAKAWVNAVESSKELYGDPLGLYRSWSKNVSDAEHMLDGSTLGAMDVTGIWQRWFEATIDIWRKAAHDISRSARYYQQMAGHDGRGTGQIAHRRSIICRTIHIFP